MSISDFSLTSELKYCDSIKIINDSDAIKDYKRMWKSAIHQKCVLVCFKSGSDEIIGKIL